MWISLDLKHQNHQSSMGKINDWNRRPSSIRIFYIYTIRVHWYYITKTPLLNTKHVLLMLLKHLGPKPSFLLVGYLKMPEINEETTISYLCIKLVVMIVFSANLSGPYHQAQLNNNFLSLYKARGYDSFRIHFCWQNAIQKSH